MSYPNYYNLDFIESNSNSPYNNPSQNVSLVSIPPVQNENGSRSFTPEPNVLPSSSVSSSNVEMSTSSNNNNNNKKRQVPVTNKHTQPQDLSKTNKKRKSNVRACDACAARKIKCAEKRPCKKCTESGIECTFNREIKKSGPKTVRPATIQRINTYQTINDITRGNDNNEIDPINDNQSNDIKIENSSINSTPSISSNTTTSNTVPNIKHRNKTSNDSDNNQSNNSPLKDSIIEVENPSLNSQIQPSTQSTRTTTVHNPTNITTNNNNNTGTNYRPTPSNLIENIRLIGEEPIIRELVQPLTVQSLILNYGKLIDFLNANFANYFNSPINPMNEEINLTNHHDDSLYLSQVLIILTINLIIAEILIKFKKRKFKNFIKYPKKNLETRNFKNFKNLCHFKCIEIFSYIEINLIVPPIIPQNAFKNNSTTTTNNNNNNAASSTTSGNSSVPPNSNSNAISSINTENSGANNPNTHNLLNLHQVFYNLSLSSLHLCNYYHTLNLTNTLNAIPIAPNVNPINGNTNVSTGSSSGTGSGAGTGITSTGNSSSASPNNTVNINHQIYAKDGNYGNEIQEYQKVMNLNRSITYFQLINIKNNNDSSLIIKLSELFEMIFTFERYYLLFSSFNYNLNRFRNNDIIIQLNSKKILKYKQENINNNYNSNKLFQLLNILDEDINKNEDDMEDIGEENFEINHFIKLCKHTSFNVKLKVIEDDSISKYWGLKQKIMSLIPNEREVDINDENLKVFEIIRYGVLFKLLLIYPISFESLRLELYELINNLNEYLKPSDSEIFKLKISNFQLLPHLLHLLKVILKVEAVKYKVINPTTNDLNNNNNNGQDLKLNSLLIDDEIKILYFSDNLSKHFTFFNNINKLIRSDGLLNNWYLNLNENRNRLINLKNAQQQSHQQQQQQQQQLHEQQHHQQQQQQSVSNMPMNQNMSPSTAQFGDGREFSIDDIIADFSSTMVNSGNNNNNNNVRPIMGLNRLSTTTTTTTNGTSTPEDEDQFMIQAQYNSFLQSPQFTPSSIYNSYQQVPSHYPPVIPPPQIPVNHVQSSRFHVSSRPHMNGSNSSSSITESSTTSSIISGSNPMIPNHQVAGLGVPVPPVLTAFTATEDTTTPLPVPGTGNHQISLHNNNNNNNNSNNNEPFITGLTPASPSGAAIKLTKSATTLLQNFASSSSLSNLFGFGSAGSPTNSSNNNNNGNSSNNNNNGSSSSNGDIKLEESNSDQFSF
ncbi:hypothetical protein DFJ63DRAFT_313319 [Scheffersomyces coipomensis]|uniref:uncharacterized protein n=1 Tax=Scheffersomyces coipomensis TaxID=1788519 RepID=UPI00315D3363